MKVNSGTNALQAMGGGLTYAKRYAIAALLGLSVDTDDDGNGDKNKTIAPKKKPSYPVANYTKGAKSIYEGKCTLKEIEGEYTVSAAAKKTINAIVDKFAKKDSIKMAQQLK